MDNIKSENNKKITKLNNLKKDNYLVNEEIKSKINLIKNINSKVMILNNNSNNVINDISNKIKIISNEIDKYSVINSKSDNKIMNILEPNNNINKIVMLYLLNNAITNNLIIEKDIVNFIKDTLSNINISNSSTHIVNYLNDLLNNKYKEYLSTNSNTIQQSNNSNTNTNNNNNTMLEKELLKIQENIQCIYLNYKNINIKDQFSQNMNNNSIKENIKEIDLNINIKLCIYIINKIIDLNKKNVSYYNKHLNHKLSYKIQNIFLNSYKLFSDFNILENSYSHCLLILYNKDYKELLVNNIKALISTNNENLKKIVNDQKKLNIFYKKYLINLQDPLKNEYNSFINYINLELCNFEKLYITKISNRLTSNFKEYNYNKHLLLKYNIFYEFEIFNYILCIIEINKDFKLDMHNNKLLQFTKEIYDNLSINNKLDSSKISLFNLLINQYNELINKYNNSQAIKVKYPDIFRLLLLNYWNNPNIKSLLCKNIINNK